jgi:hypothetical protein
MHPLISPAYVAISCIHSHFQFWEHLLHFQHCVSTMRFRRHERDRILCGVGVYCLAHFIPSFHSYISISFTKVRCSNHSPFLRILLHPSSSFTFLSSTISSSLFNLASISVFSFLCILPCTLSIHPLYASFYAFSQCILISDPLHTFSGHLFRPSSAFIRSVVSIHRLC